MKKLLFIISILCFSLSVKAEDISIETFFKFPDITSAQISPDGRHLAATVESDGRKRLAIVDLKAMKIKHIFNFNHDKKEIGGYGWLNNERIYAEMVYMVGALAQPAFTGFMYAGNIDGSQTALLLPAKARGGAKGSRTDRPKGYNILSMLPNDDRHILIAMSDDSYNEAYKLDIYKGRLKKVVRSPSKFANLGADNSGNVRVSIGRDENTQKILVHLKNDPDADWVLFTEFDEKSAGVMPIGFTKDDKNLFIRVKDGTHKTLIQKLNLETKEVDNILELNGDADIRSYVYDNDGVKPEVIGVTRMPGFVERDFFDDNHLIAKIYRSLKESFPQQEVSVVNYTRDGAKAVVRVWGDKNPGDYYLFDMKKFKLEFLLDTYPWIDRKQLAVMKPISYKARDGLDIHGYLTLPNGKSKNLPMILLVHGGPYGVTDDWRYNPEVQFFANRGYAVLQVNYRGSGGRGAKFEYDAYKQMGREMQDDLTDATLWAVEQGYADKDRLCIYGASYGGYAALMGVVKEPDLYKCAVGYVGLYDIDLIKQSDIWDRESGRIFSQEAWGIDDENFVKERSPMFHVDKIKSALFIVHGADDKRVHVDNYYDLLDALDKRSYRYESMVKPHEGHGFYDLENKVELYTQMEKFFEKHIGK